MHTPTLGENSVQVFQKRRDHGLTAVVQCSKKNCFREFFCSMKKTSEALIILINC